ncbi:MAG TPA: alkaline phosphatase family protein [Candidatus Acidoferrales bacterium]|nr:alkaline phosphatase family protein [Candidatus Acidoferrales bacterium]
MSMSFRGARPKLVLLALDSADCALARRWANAGYLPTLARLFEKGISLPIATPPGVLEGAVWPTLLTSQSVGNHGLFAYRQVIPGSYDLEIAMTADRITQPPFWFFLGQAGARVTVIDAPFARPLRNLRGLQVTNWGAHDPWCWPTSSWPRRLVGDLCARFGEHPVGMCDQKERTLAEYRDLRERLLRGARTKARLLRYCLDLEDWDFFFGVFSESHCVGHQFWHFFDASHPRYDPGAGADLNAAIRDVYREIDRGLGLLIQALPDAAHVLILFSHGMGPYYHGSHLLDHILQRLGMDEPTPQRAGGARAQYEISSGRSLVWSLSRLAPRAVRDRIKARLPHELVGRFWRWTHPEPHPWSRARAFQVPSSNMTGAIRINVKGREPAGKVEPGAEYDELCRELAEALMELQNPATGRKAVQWVARARDLYDGPMLHRLPDLFVEWDHSAPITALSSARIGTVEGVFPGSRTGSHWPHALLLAAGPEFASGEIAAKMRTVDIAPTVLDFFGAPAPRSYEGVSVLPLLASRPKANHPAEVFHPPS